MNKFRVNKPIADFEGEKHIELNNFIRDADEHKVNNMHLEKKAKPTKSFTVPMNEFELSMLQEVSKNLDRSQRYVSRMLLVQSLKKILNIDTDQN